MSQVTVTHMSQEKTVEGFRRNDVTIVLSEL